MVINGADTRPDTISQQNNHSECWLEAGERQSHQSRAAMAAWCLINLLNGETIVPPLREAPFQMDNILVARLQKVSPCHAQSPPGLQLQQTQLQSLPARPQEKTELEGADTRSFQLARTVDCCWPWRLTVDQEAETHLKELVAGLERPGLPPKHALRVVFEGLAPRLVRLRPDRDGPPQAAVHDQLLVLW